MRVTTIFLSCMCLLFAVQSRADASGDVATVLDAFHRAASESDFEQYSALMSEEMVFLGTDGTERWQGKEFRDFAEPYFREGQGWTYVPSNRHVALSANGEHAWFDEALENAQLGACRGSGVLVLEEGSWKITQYNLSVPIPNAMVVDVATEIAAQPPQ